MKFVYTPEGAEAIEWEFDPMRLLSPEAMQIEKMTGLSYVGWIEAVQSGSMTAVHALLFVLMKRRRPGIKPDEVQFSLAEIDFVPDEDEDEVEDEAEAEADSAPKAPGLSTT